MKSIESVFSALMLVRILRDNVNSREIFSHTASISSSFVSSFIFNVNDNFLRKPENSLDDFLRKPENSLNDGLPSNRDRPRMDVFNNMSLLLLSDPLTEASALGLNDLPRWTLPAAAAIGFNQTRSPIYLSSTADFRTSNPELMIPGMIRTG